MNSPVQSSTADINDVIVMRNILYIGTQKVNNKTWDSRIIILFTGWFDSFNGRV